MTRKKLTIGDNSGLNRKGERCKVVRCLDGIEVGEVVSIRFKDDDALAAKNTFRQNTTRTVAGTPARS